MSMKGGIVLTIAMAMILGMAVVERPDAEPVKTQGSELATVPAGGKDDPSPAGDTPASTSDDDHVSLERLTVEVEPGGTLLETLTGAGVPYPEAYGASETLKTAFDPRKLRAGQRIALQLAPGSDGDIAHLYRLALVPETDREVVVAHREQEGFRTQERPVDHAREVLSASGEIGASLYDAASGQGVPMPVLLQAYKILGHAVDFQRDIRAGDRFELGYESYDDGDGRGSHPGKLVYAALSLSGEDLRVHRYTTTDGYTGYFDADGRSIETSLMKTPVDGGRLSSLFGKRDHPILGYTRMHKGLDFAAPKGAPVLAAGDGVVERRSRYSSFGNYVRIEHGDGYETAYAHLSRYGDDLEVGERVRQGQVVGYVGATGLATGPNLHFEVVRDGEPVNPMALDLPSRRVLKGAEFDRFERLMRETAPEVLVQKDR